MNEQEFITELKKNNIQLTQNQLDQFKTYKDFLIEYNKHTNLTAIKEPNEIYLKHFFDSILLIKATDFNNVNTMLDIGSGAGFPGIVIKILFPNIKLTLLDSNNKKTTFLKELSKNLNLNNINIVNKRAEEFIINNYESFDLVTARAVKNLPILVELSIPFVKIKGLFVAMKSNYEDELNDSLNGIKELGANYIKTIKLNLPISQDPRSLIIIEKINKTKKSYPRSYEKIIKKPL